MKKCFKSYVAIAVIFLTALSLAQRRENFNPLKHRSFRPVNFKLPENIQRNINLKKAAGERDLKQFQEIPYQDDNLSYFEVTPVALSNGKIIMFYASEDDINHNDDTLFCILSLDGGKTWSDRRMITSSPFNSIYYITAVQTNSSRIMVFWVGNNSAVINMIYSDDDGNSWSSIKTLSASEHNIEILSVSKSINDTLLLSYSRIITSASTDLVLLKSGDDGITWGNEITISPAENIQIKCNLLHGRGSELLAVYTKMTGLSYDIVKRTSKDGGNSWSTEVPVINSSADEGDASIVEQSDTLYMVFMKDHPLSSNKYETNYDLYYSISTDNGNDWTSPVQFTYFAGYDGYPPNICLYQNHPFVAFTSDRWQSNYYVHHSWYGIIGITEDTNTPPVIFGIMNSSYFPVDSTTTILASAGDEVGIKYMQLNLYFKNESGYSVQMFDDGKHNDWEAGDDIWGAQVGTFCNNTYFDYCISVTNDGNNVIYPYGFFAEVSALGSPIDINGGFEETPAGDGNATGWYLGVSSPAEASFDVVDDTIEEENRSLKIDVTTLGNDAWSVQAVNNSFPLEPGAKYKYSIWAKADKKGAIINMDVEDQSYNVLNGYFGIPLLTDWHEYSFDFTVPTNVNSGRAAIHFSDYHNNSLLPVTFYIDNLVISKPVVTVTAVDNHDEKPVQFSLSQNYPNPFNPVTRIKYSIPFVGTSLMKFVQLKVYDILGKEVATLVNDEKPAGDYEIKFNAADLPSGIYFYRLTAGKFVDTKKLVILK